MPGEPATRDDLREWRQELRTEFDRRFSALERTLKEHDDKLDTLLAWKGPVEEWRQRVLARGDKIPGWITTAVTVGIPAIMAIATWWLMAKFPGLVGP